MRKAGITYRLFFSILGATGLAILSLFLVMQWSIDRGFYRYLGTMDQGRLEQVLHELERKYEQFGSWDFLKDTPPRWETGTQAMLPEHDAPPPPLPEGEGLRPLISSHDGAPAGTLPAEEKNERGLRRSMPPLPPPDTGRGGGPLIVLNAKKAAILGSYPGNEEVHFLPVMVHGETVGYAGLVSPKHFLNPMQVRFLSEQKLSLAIAAAGMVLVAVIISFPLARKLVGPIKAIAAATHDIALGRYATRIPVTSSDELGQLARDFNDMALTLEKHEKERRQWVADISHELRTPVAVLRGEIEALLDGIRTITPETVRSLHAEALRLNRLVEDLYQLSLSDIGALSYRKELLDVTEVLAASTDAYRAEFDRKRIMLAPDPSPRETIFVYADRVRLEQLFSNLLENSLKYTDAGGKLVIAVAPAVDRVTLEFQDSPPSVPERDLGRLFERLYRVEGSRNRASGGTGLGLAISKNIVEAHGGTITAHQSPLGGLLIRINLPTAGRPV